MVLVKLQHAHRSLRDAVIMQVPVQWAAWGQTVQPAGHLRAAGQGLLLCTKVHAFPLILLVLFSLEILLKGHFTFLVRAIVTDAIT